MARMLWRNGFLAMLAGVAIGPSAFAQNTNAPDNFQLEQEGNFITMGPGHWEASGAFSDEGTIQDVSKHDIHGSSVSVIETMAGANGTITYKWTRVNRFAPGAMGNPAALTMGAWQMVSGTGAYTGITGQGTFSGTINFETGEIHDFFTGKVTLAPNDALQFRNTE
jgi:hypothetical protein